MAMEPLQTTRFSFGDFELDAGRRLLFDRGQQVALNYRTIELLLALVSRQGDILSKDELLETVWQGQFVEEGNLTVHISALRKALGETKNENKYIVTVPGRGYSFVAELNNHDDSEIVLESHSLSRIYVEEEISDEDEIQIADVKELGPKRGASGWLRGKVPLIAASVLLMVVVVAVGGYFLLRNRVPFQHMTIKRLTSSGNVSRAAISPDGKLFAYTTPDGDLETLWLGHVDGGEPVQVRPPANEVYLAVKFAPDDSSIYYAVSANFSDGTLYKIPVFGGAPQKIRDNFRNMAFFPDGKQYAFFGFDDNAKAMTVRSADIDGANERQIAVLPSEIGTTWHSPTLSPDGSTFAFTIDVKNDDTQVWVVNLKDGKAEKLSAQSWRNMEAVGWLRDGSGLIVSGIDKDADIRQLSFISYPGGEVHRLSNDLTDWGFITSLANDNSLVVIQGSSQSNIWVAPANNLTDARQVTFGSAGRKDGWNSVVWTPDDRIAYTAETGDGSTIMIMNADGSKQKQLIPSGGTNNGLSLTADGNSMYFDSNRRGHFAVWRSNLDGTNMTQLTGDQIAGQPYVAPNGKFVIYNSRLDAEGELWRIPAEGGEPKRLWDKLAAWAQVSPDSKLIACETGTSEDKVRLAILSLETGELVKVFDIPRLANLRLGVHWTPDGHALAYRDWKNGIWKQNLDGGEPQRLEGLPEEKLLAYDWSSDGKYFALTRGTTSRDVVLITDGK